MARLKTQGLLLLKQVRAGRKQIVAVKLDLDHNLFEAVDAQLKRQASFPSSISTCPSIMTAVPNGM